MARSFYPKDKTLKDWMVVAYVVTEATWKHLDEYKSNVVGMKVPEVIRRHEAMGRGLQQASFLVIDESKKEEMDIDDVLNVVSIFYLAALEVVRYMVEDVKGGDHSPEGLRATAENLLRCAEEWSKVYGKTFDAARGGEE